MTFFLRKIAHEINRESSINIADRPLASLLIDRWRHCERSEAIL